MTDATDLFLGLTPDAVLDAIEATGLRCGNVCLALNSFENRVYEIELRDRYDRHGDRLRVIAKFYRPNRWTEPQIRAEHAMLGALDAADIPVCNVFPLPNGDTLARAGHIHFCLFDRRGGRAPEEITDTLASRLGSLAARMHNVAADVDASSRHDLTADRLDDALDWLLERDLVPENVRDRYEDAGREIAAELDDRLDGVAIGPIHGDLHAGNLILRPVDLAADAPDALWMLDFDDMMRGPVVQDLWLLLPGRDPTTLLRRAHFLAGYERFRHFDRSSLRLIEPLRGYRYITYARWLARRWHDPIFPLTWPQFGTDKWWRTATDDLEDVLAHLDAPTVPDATIDVTEGYDDTDYFWDQS